MKYGGEPEVTECQVKVPVRDHINIALAAIGHDIARFVRQTQCRRNLPAKPRHDIRRADGTLIAGDFVGANERSQPAHAM